MPDEYASFDDDVETSEMSINVQKKGWKDILRTQCIEKVYAHPDEIDLAYFIMKVLSADHKQANNLTSLIICFFKQRIYSYFLLSMLRPI